VVFSSEGIKGFKLQLEAVDVDIKLRLFTSGSARNLRKIKTIQIILNESIFPDNSEIKLKSSPCDQRKIILSSLFVFDISNLHVLQNLIFFSKFL